MVCGVVSALSFSPPEAQAVPASDWNPGFIISDTAFYNYGSMNAAQIQTFLNEKGASCQAGTVPCLKDYRMTTPTMAKDSYCGAYQGGTNETAATIIAKVAQTCRISPQVMLVTLEKERSLVTKAKPISADYLVAAGYGCPDTAACATEYYGFFNQVYRMARQFRIYAALPGSFNVKAYATNTIAYNPNSSCGSSRVYVENQATASLYNYTPYQPNKAALASLYGTGDSCSAYGNRNFWTFFVDWFGDPDNPAFGQFKTLGPMTWLLNGQPSGIYTSFGVSVGNVDGSKVELLWQIYDISEKTWTTIGVDAPNWISYAFPHTGQYLVHVEGVSAQGQHLEYNIGWTVQDPKIVGFTWTNVKGLKGEFGVGVQYADPGTQYQWLYYDLDAKTWTLLLDWNTSNWMTFTAPQKGSYLLYVTVRPPNGTDQTSAMGWIIP